MSRKPNILWICTDQQRYDTSNCTGNPFVKTPNIDSLARDGVLMDGAYTVCPVCAPSRAAFLTGRYPRTCGVRQNGQDIPETEYLLPRMLADNGYVCGLSGKLHISACMPSVCKDVERRINDGYSFFSWSHHPARVNGGNNWPGNDYTNWLASLGMDSITERLPECRYVEKGMPKEYSQTRWCFDEAMKFISMQDDDQPWMFSLNCFDPHHAFDPPYEYLERYLPILDKLPLPDYIPGELESKSVFQRKDHVGAYDSPGHLAYDAMTDLDHRYITAAYYAMIDQIDDNVGRIVDFLKEKGQYENTIIVYMSDHGESLGDHGIYLKGPYFYESAVHVPLIISQKGRLLENVRRSALVELTDIAPTLCDLSGIPLYAGFQGKSFSELLLNEDRKDEFRNSVYSEFYNANIKHRNPLAFVTMVRNRRWKLVRPSSLDGSDYGSELYDLENDPGEHNNLYYNNDYLDIKARCLNCWQTKWRRRLILCL